MNENIAAHNSLTLLRETNSGIPTAIKDICIKVICEEDLTENMDRIMCLLNRLLNVSVLLPSITE